MDSQQEDINQDPWGTYHKLREDIERLQRRQRAVLGSIESRCVVNSTTGSTSNSAALGNSTFIQGQSVVNSSNGSTPNLAALDNSTSIQGARDGNIIPDFSALEFPGFTGLEHLDFAGLNTDIPQFTGSEGTLTNPTGPENMVGNPFSFDPKNAMLAPSHSSAAPIDLTIAQQVQNQAVWPDLTFDLNNTRSAPSQTSAAPINGTFAQQAQNQARLPEFTGFFDMGSASSRPPQMTPRGTNAESISRHYFETGNSTNLSAAPEDNRGHLSYPYGQDYIQEQHQRTRSRRRRQRRALEGARPLQQNAGLLCRHLTGSSVDYRTRRTIHRQDH